MDEDRDLRWLDGYPLLTPLRANERFQTARATVLARAQPVRDALVAPL